MNNCCPCCGAPYPGSEPEPESGPRVWFRFTTHSDKAYRRIPMQNRVEAFNAVRAAFNEDGLGVLFVLYVKEGVEVRGNCLYVLSNCPTDKHIYGWLNDYYTKWPLPVPNAAPSDEEGQEEEQDHE